MPMAENFLSNKDIIEQYLPEDASIESFEFDTCSGPDCLDYTPKGKKSDIVYCYIGTLI